MITPPLRVGIVGGHPQRGWAHDAHIPALRALSGWTIGAVSARTATLAEAAREAFGAQRAYDDSLALVRATDIDVVAITVKVPEHRPLILAALAAGKHVYCEWPLARDVDEAVEVAAAVRPQHHVMIGLQGLSAPAVRCAMDLARSGALGKLRVLRVFSPTVAWGAEALPHYAYLQDKRTGATLASIAGGHTLALIEALAGAYAAVDARNSIWIPRVRVQGSEEVIERTCSDHMLVLGHHRSGCVSTLEVIGATSSPFTLELIGEHGSLRISGERGGGYQVGALKLETTVSAQAPPPPAVPSLGAAPPAHLAEAYVRFGEDIRAGTRTVPDFAMASSLTRLLAAIDTASSSGMRQQLDGCDSG